MNADGMGLAVVLQERGNQDAAETLLRRLVERQPSAPRVIVTAKPAGKKVLPQAQHRAQQRVNNRTEHRQQPTRRRE